MVWESKGSLNITKLCYQSGGGDLTKRKSLHGLEEPCSLSSIPVTIRASVIWQGTCGVGNQNSAMQIIQQGFRVEVNSGDKTQILGTSWLGNLALKQEFVRLFLLSTQKQSLAMDWAGNTSNGRWNLNFRKSSICVG